MKPTAKTNFTLKGKLYKKGKEVKISSKEELIKLNEMGFIEPLTIKEIQEFKEKEGKENE